MSEASRKRFADTMRGEPVDLALACLLIGAEVDQTLDPEPSLRELDAIAASVDRGRPPVEALRGALAGFTGDAHDYGDLRSSLLYEVLRRRAGLPILLSVVWLEVADRCGIPAYGVGLPGHFVVRVGEEHVDPFAGGAPLDVTGVPEQHLRPWRAEEILLRVLTNIRAWAGQSPRRGGARMWAVELSLLLPHHPADLRREHGALLVAGGDFPGGARELETYAEAVEAVDPAAAERAKRDARAARARLNQLPAALERVRVVRVVAYLRRLVTICTYAQSAAVIGAALMQVRAELDRRQHGEAFRGIFAAETTRESSTGTAAAGTIPEPS